GDESSEWTSADIPVDTILRTGGSACVGGEMGLMRMQTGWLLGLLAAGTVLMPTVAYGQGGNIGAEGPVVPPPPGHDHFDSGGFFVAAEFLFWRQTVPLKDQQIAVRGVLDQDGSISQAFGGPNIPGGFFGSRFPALRANDAAGPGTYEPGFRITGGWR